MRMELLLLLARALGTLESMGITVIDGATGRGIPLAFLELTSKAAYVSDSGGRIALLEPGLENRTLFASIWSPGYVLPRDGFGFRGVKFAYTPGGRLVVPMRREQRAERLYRFTGSGQYRDTVLLGLGGAVPAQAAGGALLDAGVMGQDSVQAVVDADANRTLFFWGDTNQPGYPLGSFMTTGAQAPPPAALDAAVGMPLEYFSDGAGFVAPMAPPQLRDPSTGPVWVGGLFALPGSGVYCVYTKGGMAAWGFGMLRFDPQARAFALVAGSQRNLTGAGPDGLLRRMVDGLLGSQAVVHAGHVYFASPYALIRVAASPAAVADLAQYEAFGCLRQNASMARPVVDREGGVAAWRWRTRTPPTTEQDQASLLKAGLLRPDERHFSLHERGTGTAVALTRGSVQWNAFLGRWVLLAQAAPGTVWISAAAQIEGPYVTADLIANHNSTGSTIEQGCSSAGAACASAAAYNYYNPTEHAFLQNGSLIYFSGTLSTSFAPERHPVARYDYNSIMMRVDVSFLT